MWSYHHCINWGIVSTWYQLSIALQRVKMYHYYVHITDMIISQIWSQIWYEHITCLYKGILSNWSSVQNCSSESQHLHLYDMIISQMISLIWSFHWFDHLLMWSFTGVIILLMRSFNWCDKFTNVIISMMPSYPWFHHICIM